MPERIILSVRRSCEQCGEEEEFTCDECEAAICSVCVRYKGERILCPSCDDNTEQ